MQKRYMNGILLGLVCTLLLATGCGASNEARTQANVEALEAYLNAPDAEYLAEKVVIQHGRDGEEIAYEGEAADALAQALTRDKTKVDGVEILESTPQYVALRYNLRNFYFDVLDMPSVEYNAVYYFKRGLINKIVYIQGDRYRDAQLAEYTKGSFGIKLGQDGQTIEDVQPDSPAQAAGLLPGDTVTAVDELAVEDMNQSLEELEYRLHGIELTRAKVTVRRADREITVLMQRIAGLTY